MADHLQGVPFEEKGGRVFPQVRSGGQNLRLVGAQAVSAQSVKNADMLKGAPQGHHIADPNITVIHINAVANSRAKSSQDFSKDGRRNVGPQDAEDIPMGVPQVVGYH
jgi:hypothetical protein